jgi:c-di-GMP-binding flagellar brake protein YcgR
LGGQGYYERFVPIRSRDISLGGVGFETRRKLPLESESRFMLSSIGDLPDTATIEGKVVYLAQNPVSLRYSVGVEFMRFIHVTPEQLLAKIRTWESLPQA